MFEKLKNTMVEYSEIIESYACSLCFTRRKIFAHMNRVKGTIPKSIQFLNPL